MKVCQHPNIIKLYDYYEDMDNMYMVMEYIKGRDLYDYLKYKNSRNTEERAKQISFSILKGLEYLDSMGILHRDLKLENIMMSDKTDTAEPILIDFGLGAVLGPGQKASGSSGTVGYCAPEILTSNASYRGSCDMWGFGCITHVLLSGHLPFDSSDRDELITLTKEVPFKFN